MGQLKNRIQQLENLLKNKEEPKTRSIVGFSWLIKQLNGGELTPEERIKEKRASIEYEAKRAKEIAYFKKYGKPMKGSSAYFAWKHPDDKLSQIMTQNESDYMGEKGESA